MEKDTDNMFDVKTREAGSTAVHKIDEVALDSLCARFHRYMAVFGSKRGFGLSSSQFGGTPTSSKIEKHSKPSKYLHAIKRISKSSFETGPSPIAHHLASCQARLPIKTRSVRREVLLQQVDNILSPEVQDFVSPSVNEHPPSSWTSEAQPLSISSPQAYGPHEMKSDIGGHYEGAAREWKGEDKFAGEDKVADEDDTDDFHECLNRFPTHDDVNGSPELEATTEADNISSEFPAGALEVVPTHAGKIPANLFFTDHLPFGAETSAEVAAQPMSVAQLPPPTSAYAFPLSMKVRPSLSSCNLETNSNTSPARENPESGAVSIFQPSHDAYTLHDVSPSQSPPANNSAQPVDSRFCEMKNEPRSGHAHQDILPKEDHQSNIVGMDSVSALMNTYPEGFKIFSTQATVKVDPAPMVENLALAEKSQRTHRIVLAGHARDIPDEKTHVGKQEGLFATPLKSGLVKGHTHICRVEIVEFPEVLVRKLLGSNTGSELCARCKVEMKIDYASGEIAFKPLKEGRALSDVKEHIPRAAHDQAIVWSLKLSFEDIARVQEGSSDRSLCLHMFAPSMSARRLATIAHHGNKDEDWKQRNYRDYMHESICHDYIQIVFQTAQSYARHWLNVERGSEDHLGMNLWSAFVAEEGSFHFKYKLQHQLGSPGAFGTVYACIHRHTGEERAVKILFDEDKADDEAQIQAKYSQSEYVVNLYEVFKGDGAVFLVMEQMHDMAFVDVLNKRDIDLTISQHRDIAERLLRGLAEIHGYGDVHRDIKLDNILVQKQSYGLDYTLVKYGDFGQSRQLYNPNTMRNLSRTFTPGTHIGTPQYQAPELSGTTGHGKPQDIWSLGICLYMMVFLEMFHFEYGFNVIHAIARDIKDPRHSICQLLEHMLIIQPSERWTASELLKHEWFGRHSESSTRTFEQSSTGSSRFSYNKRSASETLSKVASNSVQRKVGCCNSSNGTKIDGMLL